MISEINSIYSATEGEGVCIGRPQIFVRYQGCNIGCQNCDSKQTWDFNTLNSIKNLKILDKIKSLSTSIKWISITGGDPLHPSHRESVLDLIKLLKDNNYKINIEASGIVIVKSIFDLVDFISWDVKLSSTGVAYKKNLTLDLLKQYSTKLQIKSVVQDKADFIELSSIYNKYNTNNFENWVITPAFCPEEDNIKKRFIEINRLNEENGNSFRVIGQQHKWIYGSKRADV